MSVLTATPTSLPVTLVGLSGWPGSGRGVAARALAGAGWTVVGVGDVLRDVALAANPLIPLGTTGASRRLSTLVASAGWPRTLAVHQEAREFLARLDADAGRGVFGPGVWTQATIARARRARPAVIPDLTGPGEVAAVRAAGGLVVRLSHPGARPRPDGEALDDPVLWDAHVVNAGTPAELGAAILGLAGAHGDASPPAPRP